VKAVVVLAALIHGLTPQMSRSNREAYARIVNTEAARVRADPLLMLAIIEHESRWNPRADNGKCVGLGQICLETQSACRGAEGLNASACQARRAALFDGATNIHAMAGALAAGRAFCGKSAKLADIVSSYAGTGACGRNGGRQHKITRDIIDIYRTLKREVRR
jgi:hypothetical protein